MQEKFSNLGSMPKILVVFLYSLITALVILILKANYFAIVVVVFAPFILIFLLNKPFALLTILMLSMPFSVTSLFDMQLMGVPGLKLINILFVMTFFSFIHAKIPVNVQFNEKLFILGTITLLLIATIRSVPHISLFNIIWDEHYSINRYFQSFLLKPIIYLSPFIYLSLFISDRRRLHKMLKAYIVSIVLLSAFLLSVYIFIAPDRANFESVRESFSMVMHLHANSLATIYTISFPIILSSFFIRKSILSLICLILVVLAIGILYSRTAYLLVILSIFLYLFISKRFKLLPLLLCVCVGLSFFIPHSIKDRAMTGFQSKDRNEISAGRIDDIWIPLIEEISRSPKAMLIGKGRYAIIFSKAHNSGVIYRTGHAHNMYLDCLLDIGLIGLMFFLGFFLFYLMRCLTHVKKLNLLIEDQEMLYGVIVSIICFLIAGMTGRSFFPELSNYPIWLVLAFGSVVIKLSERAKGNYGDISG